ncbi:MAG: sulfatase-like hydrolase/transferase, partial [Candidatus Aminicenantes bacterium]|nr:sulfatase-like hydrolase/transferase [Candidatus Aminicenantes bacterium]
HVLTGLFPKIVRKAVYAPMWTLWAWGLLFLVLVLLVIRCRCGLNTLTGLLNVFVTVLLVFSLWQIASFYLLPNHPFTPRVRDEAEDRNLMQQRVIPRDKLPDIYYLIFDRYASKKNLMQFYDYDNTPFYSLLQEKEFFVAERSNSNHIRTYLSLCSSLNMDYMPDLLGKLPVQKRVIYRMLQNNRILRLLKALGYTYIHLGSWYEPTKVNHFADINYPGAKLSDLAQDFTLKFLNITALAPLGLSKYSHRKSVLNKFRELFQVSERPGPKFVFLHMLVPHSPFVFGPNGETLRTGDLVKRTVEQKYVDQIRYLNRRIEELVNAIMAHAKISPIIIIQSDEGPSKSESPVNHLAKFKKKRRPFIKNLMGFGILNAYFFPGKDRSIFYDSISPVNTFRLLFNSYFGTHYTILPDISFNAKETRDKVLEFKVVPNSFFAANMRVRSGKAVNRRRAAGLNGRKKQK